MSELRYVDVERESSIILSMKRMTRETILEEYVKAEKEAWNEYENILIPALTECENKTNDAFEEYKKIKKSNWEEYKKIKIPAYEEYKKKINVAYSVAHSEYERKSKKEG